VHRQASSVPDTAIGGAAASSTGLTRLYLRRERLTFANDGVRASEVAVADAEVETVHDTVQGGQARSMNALVGARAMLQEASWRDWSEAARVQRALYAGRDDLGL
jgi:hypothetical protein